MDAPTADQTSTGNGRPDSSPGSAGPDQLRHLLDAVMVIGSDLDLATVLRRIVETATALVGTRRAR